MNSMMLHGCRLFRALSSNLKISAGRIVPCMNTMYELIRDSTGEFWRASALRISCGCCFDGQVVMV